MSEVRAGGSDNGRGEGHAEALALLVQALPWVGAAIRGDNSVTATLKVSEADFTDMVIDYAKVRGWRVYHALPARTSTGWRTATQGDIGWPDLFMVRGPTVIVAELKSEEGTLTSEQAAWLQDLGDALVGQKATGRHSVHTWRPSSWPFIEEILK